MSMNSVFHLGCTEIKLANLCFVDDQLIFSMEKCKIFRALQSITIFCCFIMFESKSN
jgi:hypothetical protein